MEDRIRKQVEPIINDFVKSVEDLKIKEGLKCEQLNAEIERTKKEQDNLRTLLDENRVKAQMGQDRIDKELARLKGLQDNIEEEIKKYNALSNEVKKLKSDADNNLKDAQIERKLAEDLVEAEKVKAKALDLKLKALETDTAKLDLRVKELDERERKIKVQEKVNADIAQKNAAKDAELDERAADLKIKENNINLARKKLKAG